MVFNSPPSARKREEFVGYECTSLERVSAYDSGYAGNPEINFEPGMKGKIVNTIASVRYASHPLNPKCDWGYLIHFEHPNHKGIQRTMLRWWEIEIL